MQAIQHLRDEVAALTKRNVELERELKIARLPLLGGMVSALKRRFQGPA